MSSVNHGWNPKMSYWFLERQLGMLRGQLSPMWWTSQTLTAWILLHWSDRYRADTKAGGYHIWSKMSNVKRWSHSIWYRLKLFKCASACMSPGNTPLYAQQGSSQKWNKEVSPSPEWAQPTILQKPRGKISSLQHAQLGRGPGDEGDSLLISFPKTHIYRHFVFIASC